MKTIYRLYLIIKPYFNETCQNKLDVQPKAFPPPKYRNHHLYN